MEQHWIAHFRTPFLSRSETFIYGFLTRLKPPFHPVVFTTDRIHADQFPFDPVVNYSVRRFLPPWFLEQACKRVLRRGRLWLHRGLRKRRISLIHAHFGEEAYHLLDAKRRLGLPMVTTFYGHDMSEVVRDPLWVKRYLELFADGDLFLVEGPHMKRALEALGCPAEKVRIQHIAVDLDRLAYRERQPKEHAVFLFCGRFIEKKGAIVALKALRRLKDQGMKNFELRLIGYGPLEPELRRYASEQGLDGLAIFCGGKTHAEFYQALDEADVLVAPSVTAADGDSEGGAPTVILEAQASGLPIVASRHADIPAVVAEGKSALLCEERDDEGLARHMRWMLENKAAWADFSREGRRHVAAHHDLNKEVRRLEQTYLELIRRREAVIGGIDQDLSARIADIAVRTGGEDLFAEVCRAVRPEEITRALILLSPFYHGAWRLYLDASAPRRKILVVDPEAGSYALAAARRADETVAWCKDPAATRALEVRARVEGVRIQAVCSDPGAAGWPFPDESFDLVVVHRWRVTLERYGKVASFWRSETEALRECRRVLKPGGTLYLDGTTAGWPDLLRKGTMERFFPLPLSHRIGTAGFQNQQFLKYWHDPEGYLYKAATLADLPASGKLKAALTAALKPTLIGILSRKPPSRPQPSLLQAMARKLPNARPGSASGQSELFAGSAGVYRFQSRGYIGRIPFNPDSLARCRNNIVTLRALEGLGLSFQVPRFVAEESVDGQPFFIETRIPGRAVPYLRLPGPSLGAFAVQAQKVLSELHAKSVRRHVLDRAAFDRLFAEPFRTVSRNLDEGTRAGLQDLQAFLESRFLGKNYPCVRAHGDFKISNFLMNAAQRITGLVDWDLSTDESLPVVDLIFYRGFEKSLIDKVPFSQAIYQAGLAVGHLDPLLRAYMEGLEIDPGDLKIYGTMALLNYFNKIDNPNRQSNSNWRTRNMTELLRAACRAILEPEGALR